jgi:uncharacterized protein involved in response to NO
MTLRLYVQRLSEEPYRVFFPFGILAGLAGVSHWLFYALKWIPEYSMLVHSSIQIQVYMGAFVLGFLLTAMPRFASAPAATTAEFSAFFACLILVLGAYLSGHLTLGKFGFILWMLMLVRFAVIRLVLKKSAKIKPPVEFVWIAAALVHGLTGTSLLLLQAAGRLPVWATAVGKPMMDQGFLLCVVLGVGSFLGPRLMGTFSPLLQVGKDSAEKISRERRGKMLFHLAMAFVLFASFILEGLRRPLEAFALRAVLITAVYFKTKTLVAAPKVRDPFVRLLWFSFWMVWLGHVLAVPFPAFRAVLLHIVFIGGYSLMTFAVGTMVVFSHAGKSELLQKPSWQLNFIAAATAAALGLRVGAIFTPEHYFTALGAASVSWILAALCWLFYILPQAFSFLGLEEFERCHDEAKQRVDDIRKS